MCQYGKLRKNSGKWSVGFKNVLNENNGIFDYNKSVQFNLDDQMTVPWSECMIIYMITCENWTFL